jgi:hypothetical protein
MMQAAATATVALKIIQSSQVEALGSAAGADSGCDATDSASALPPAGFCLRFFERLDAIGTGSGGLDAVAGGATGIVVAV